jgi:hypothetical protein
MRQRGDSINRTTTKEEMMTHKTNAEINRRRFLALGAAALASPLVMTRAAYENKLEFTKLYNGACTRLGEKEINAFANDFIDKIRSNGELAKIYSKWMNNPMPVFPDSISGIPFTAS